MLGKKLAITPMALSGSDGSAAMASPCSLPPLVSMPPTEAVPLCAHHKQQNTRQQPTATATTARHHKATLPATGVERGASCAA